MISEITIENAAVIKQETVTLSDGFSAFTGETGAGKSVFAKAISFAAGSNAGADFVRHGADALSVTVVFENIGESALESLAEYEITPDEDGVIILERTLNNDGKNKFKINGKSTTRSVYRNCGSVLISVSGQFENTLLLKKNAHIGILDAFSDIEDEKNNYRVIYDDYISKKTRLDDFNYDVSEIERRKDMLRFVINEIEEAKLKEEEYEELLVKKKKIKDFEKIASASQDISNALFKGGTSPSAYDLCYKAKNSLKKISDYIEDYEFHIEKLDGIMSYLQDLSSLSEDLYDPDEFGNPTSALDKIESRLALIDALRRKYGNEISDILNYLEKSRNELSELDDYDSAREKLEADVSLALKETIKKAGEISKIRKVNAKRFISAVKDNLSLLDMGNTIFDIKFETLSEPNKNGIDDVEFMISSNPNEPLKGLSDTASGGELSRVMLSIKSVTIDKSETDTVLFDEIDTGVSGKTASRIGEMLKRAGEKTQILCITHSAQVASYSDNHYLVEKIINERAESTIKLLDEQGRIAEIARIMGGERITENLTASAAELLDQTNN